MRRQIVILALLTAVLLAPAVWSGVSSLAYNMHTQLAATTGFEDIQVGPKSANPQKDILEISRAFGVLYGVDGCSLAKSMSSVFGVECNLKQNCRGPGSFQGSFQMGTPFVQGALNKLGPDLSRMGQLVEEGKIDRNVYRHMLEAARQGRAMGVSSGRLHHMYATMLATAKHVQMEAALQKRTSNQLERSAAHVAFQFTPPVVQGAIKSGSDRRAKWYGNCNLGNLSVFGAIVRLASGGTKCSPRLTNGASSMNCSLTGGYGSTSGFGSILASPLQDSLKNTPLGRFFGGQSGLGGGGSSGGSSSSIGSGGSSQSQSQYGGSYGEGGSSSASNNTTNDSSNYDSTNDGWSSWFTTPSTGDTSSSLAANVVYQNSDEPILNCLPNVVEQNEPVLVLWQCRNGAELIELNANEQPVALAVGASMGKINTNLTTDTEYNLTCGEKTAQCDVEVINPALALMVSTTTVPMWDTVELSWSSVDTTSCELNSDDDSSKYVDWKRSGTSSIEGVLSHAITKETVFALTCSTKMGTEVEKAITVIVQ